jgi:hypothetical protein
MHGERKKETLFVPLECEHHEPADARWAHLQGQLSLCLKSPGKPALKLLSLLSRARPTPRPCLPNSEFCLASVRTQSTKGRWVVIPGRVPTRRGSHRQSHARTVPVLLWYTMGRIWFPEQCIMGTLQFSKQHTTGMLWFSEQRTMETLVPRAVYHGVLWFLEHCNMGALWFSGQYTTGTLLFLEQCSLGMLWEHHGSQCSGSWEY